MVKIYVFNVSEYQKSKESSLFTENSPFTYFAEKSKKEKSERARMTLAEGELLLLAMKSESSEKIPAGKFETTEFGKLIFTKTDKSAKNIDFSIAHSNGVLVVAVSDIGAVGVDIERADREIDRGVAKKFLSDFSPSSDALFAKLYRAEMSDDGISAAPTDVVEERRAELGDTERWCAMEALVKMSGEGLAAHGKAAKLQETARLSVFTYKEKGAVYTLAVALAR